MTEKNYVVNVKTKLGTIITVRGDSPAELDANIDGYIDRGLSAKIGILENDIIGGVVASASDPVALVAQTLGATVTAVTPTVTPTAPSLAPVPPPVASAPAGVGDKHCVHGTMVKRTGSGAKGEWRAFFCPTPKGTADQCSPQFAQRNTPEWNSF